VRQVDRVPAELAHPRLERDARSEAGPLEEHRQRPSRERWRVVPASLAEFSLEPRRSVEDAPDLGGRQVGDAEQVAPDKGEGRFLGNAHATMLTAAAGPDSRPTLTLVQSAFHGVHETSPCPLPAARSASIRSTTRTKLAPRAPGSQFMCTSRNFSGPLGARQPMRGKFRSWGATRPERGCRRHRRATSRAPSRRFRRKRSAAPERAQRPTHAWTAGRPRP
jgi:hypothetical protein